MRVLVTGASGFLGRATVRAFGRAGHEVRGLVRTPSAREAVRADGGTPVLGDLLRLDGLAEAVRGVDTVVHLAQGRGGSLETSRAVRVLGLERLLSTARPRRVVVGSGYWVYADNPGWVTEESPLRPLSISKTNFDTEEVGRAWATRSGGDVVVVRPGMVYGDGSWFRSMVDEIRSGEYRYIRPGENFLSPISLDDAGEAFRVAAESGIAGDVVLAVDDDPVQTRAFAETVAAGLARSAPDGISFEEAARDWGKELALLNAASRRASNRRLRSLGWTPRFPSSAEPVRTLLASMRPSGGDPLSGRPTGGEDPPGPSH